ncbi:MAG: hypothetical protein ACRD0Z_14710 [Acidimicrobiales bacterium]
MTKERRDQPARKKDGAGLLVSIRRRRRRAVINRTLGASIRSGLVRDLPEDRFGVTGEIGRVLGLDRESPPGVVASRVLPETGRTSQLCQAKPQLSRRRRAELPLSVWSPSWLRYSRKPDESPNPSAVAL